MDTETKFTVAGYIGIVPQARKLPNSTGSYISHFTKRFSREQVLMAIALAAGAACWISAMMYEITASTCSLITLAISVITTVFTLAAIYCEK